MTPAGSESGVSARETEARRLADFEIIETKDGLDALVQDLLGARTVAIDTEADSFYHYFDKTCLVQVATRRNIYLIDPLALGGPAELAALGPVFASPDICKIFHAAEYDLFVLKRDCGFEFKNLFDTMVSAQLLGYPSVGLSSIAERHFGVKLPKDEQRSDWSQRPLSNRQLHYAASDVLYLISLAEKLTKELRETKRYRWAQEEFETLCARAWPDRDFDELGYLRIKGARRLDPKGLSILRALYLLRDARAREVDRPPFKVLGNRTLLDIAEARPGKLADLGEIKGITDLLLRRMGRDIMAAAALKVWRTGRATELSMDPGVLCPNSALEAIAWRAPGAARDLKELPELKGWFQREFGAEVTQVSREADASATDEATSREAAGGEPRSSSGRSSRGRGSRGRRSGSKPRS
jgi:ribonuclease D